MNIGKWQILLNTKWIIRNYMNYFKSQTGTIIHNGIGFPPIYDKWFQIGPFEFRRFAPIKQNPVDQEPLIDRACDDDFTKSLEQWEKESTDCECWDGKENESVKDILSKEGLLE